MGIPTRRITSADELLIRGQVFDVFDQAVDTTKIEEFHRTVGAERVEPQFIDDTFHIYTAIELPQVTSEYEDPAESTKTFKGSKKIDPVKFTQSVVISDEAYYWFSQGYGRKLTDSINETADLVYSLLHLEQQSATRVFTEGWNSSFQATVTGEPLFDDSHPLVESSLTNDNDMGDTPLTPDSYAEACEKLDSMKDDRGYPMGASTDKILMVGPRLKHYAQTFIMSPGIMDTSNLATNIFSKEQLMVNPYLTNTAEGDYSYYWFVIDRNRSQRQFKYIDAMPLEFKEEETFLKGWRFGMRKQFEYLFTDHHWVVGAKATSRNDLSQSYS